MNTEEILCVAEKRSRSNWATLLVSVWKTQEKVGLQNAVVDNQVEIRTRWLILVGIKDARSFRYLDGNWNARKWSATS